MDIVVVLAICATVTIAMLSATIVSVIDTATKKARPLPDQREERQGHGG